jgi:hypothetical protein
MTQCVTCFFSSFLWASLRSKKEVEQVVKQLGGEVRVLFTANSGITHILAGALPLPHPPASALLWRLMCMQRQTLVHAAQVPLQVTSPGQR